MIPASAPNVFKDENVTQRKNRLSGLNPTPTSADATITKEVTWGHHGNQLFVPQRVTDGFMDPEMEQGSETTGC